MISMIVAISEDLGIGMKNKLLWNIPEDMKRFRRLTMGNTIVMGKKTWESLPKKPLSGRKNIVITDVPGEKFEGAISAYSVEDAIALCKSDKEAFIIGGGSIYRQFMSHADRLYITHVHKKAPADVYFPEIDPKEWEISESEEFKSMEADSVPYTYIVYKRKLPR